MLSRIASSLSKSRFVPASFSVNGPQPSLIAVTPFRNVDSCSVVAPVNRFAL